VVLVEIQDFFEKKICSKKMKIATQKRTVAEI